MNMSLTHPLKSILRIALVLLVIIHGLLLPAQSLDELTSKYERMPLDSLLALDGRSSEIRINAIVTNLIHDRYV